MRKLWALKIRRYARLWWRIGLRDTLAPFFDKKDIFHLLSLPIFLLLIFIASGEDAMKIEIWSLGMVGTALLLTLPIWFVLNLLLAPFRVWKEERDRGRWFGHRFVYHSPQPVFTTLVAPSDNGNSIRFTVEDAEPNAFVQFKIIYDGGLAKVRIESPLARILGDWDAVSRRTQYGARIDSRRTAILSALCPENSDPTIVRVQMLTWKV
jgi:hypothetical protein